MHKRQLIAQAYLYTLVFALLSVAGVCLLDSLLREQPNPHHLFLSPGSLAIALALGLALLAGSLAALLALRRRGAANDWLRLDRRTLLAGLGGVLLSTAGWYLLSLQHIHSLEEQSNSLLSRLHTATGDTLNARLALMRRMSERWTTMDSLPGPALWQQEADSYLRDIPSITLIAELDEQLQVGPSRTRSAEDQVWLEDFIADPARRSWLEAARRGAEPHLSQVQLHSGRHPIALVAMPVPLAGEPHHLLVAGLDLRFILDRLIKRGQVEFVVEVHEGDQLLYSSAGGTTRELLRLDSREIPLETGLRWTLSSWLDPSHELADNHYLALLVLLGGLLLSGLLMFSLRMAWLAQAQAQRLEAEQRYTDDQRKILGLISTLQPLDEILREICLLIERQAPQVLSSVYQVDCSGQRLSLRAAPSLGEDYGRAIQSLPIGEGVGACGTAAFRREAVLVEDIPHDRRWKGHQQLAADEGLHSCWSTPLLAGDGELLGTFAIYQRQPIRVDAQLRALVATASQLAAVAIEHRNTLDELERSNRELQEFAFVASHDLQEPLRKIQTFAEQLTSRASGLDEQSRDYLARMNSAAARMQALIRDLLAYSRLNTRRQPFVRVELDSLLDQVLQDLDDLLLNSGAILERGPLPAVQGDPSQLRQLLQNLIGNALKFHKPSEAPRVRVLAERLKGGEWNLCVSDEGIGFDEKYLERILQPFQRLHGRHAYPGTGIGLAIVKRVAEHHGARLSARSQPGQGATFCITFPRSDKE